jgi:HrpA-like RNA helicase
MAKTNEISYLKKHLCSTVFILLSISCFDTTIHVHKVEDQGDVLVFLTGQAEIEQAAKFIQDAADKLDYSTFNMSKG